MKFNIFWMWNPSFPYCLMVWYKHYLRLMKRDFQKSQIIWYLLFSVCEKSDETSKLHRNSDFITFKEEMSKLLRISAFQPHTVSLLHISLSPSPTFCFSRSFSQSQRGMSLCVWFPLSLLSGMMFKRWLSARFPSTCLYSIDAQIKYNGQNMTHSQFFFFFFSNKHQCLFWCFFSFTMKKWQINAIDLKGKWKMGEEKRTINRVIRFIPGLSGSYRDSSAL